MSEPITREQVKDALRNAENTLYRKERGQRHVRNLPVFKRVVLFEQIQTLRKWLKENPKPVL